MRERPLARAGPASRGPEGTLREHQRGRRRARTVTDLRAIPSSCATFVPAASRACPWFPFQSSMVRRGSTVRVRQRASQQRPANTGFCRLGACVASNRCLAGIVIRQAAIAGQRSSWSRRSPKTRTAFASSPRISVVSGSPSCWARSTNAASVGDSTTPGSRLSCSSARSSAAAAACSEAEPPRCTRRAAAADPVAVRPAHPVSALARERKHLSVLRHRGTPSSRR